MSGKDEGEGQRSDGVQTGSQKQRPQDMDLEGDDGGSGVDGITFIVGSETSTCGQPTLTYPSLPL